MAKREVIILSVMVIVVIYGLYEFFYTAPAEKTTSVKTIELKVDDLNQLTADVEKLLEPERDSRDTYIVSRAEMDWLVDPFYLSRAMTEEELRLFFTGYIEMGKRRIAIINGMDYEVGDHLLERPGFQVRSIRPNEVVITDRRGIANIPIPFVE